MRVRLGHLRLLAVVALFAPLAVPGAARASDTEIVVEGARSSYADVEVHEDIYVSDVRFTVSGSGTYVGMVFEPRVHSSQTAGQPSIFALRAASLGSTPISHPSNGWIKPGSYRAWILSDRPARVVIPVSRGGFSIRTSQRATARLVTLASTVSSTGPSALQHRYDRAMSPGWGALVGLRVSGTRAESTYACASDTGDCPTRLPIGFPSTSDEVGGAYLWSAQRIRDILVGTEGARVGSGELVSAALMFTAS